MLSVCNHGSHTPSNCFYMARTGVIYSGCRRLQGASNANQEKQAAINDIRANTNGKKYQDKLNLKVVAMGHRTKMFNKNMRRPCSKIVFLNHERTQYCGWRHWILSSNDACHTGEVTGRHVAERRTPQLIPNTPNSMLLSVIHISSCNSCSAPHYFFRMLPGFVCHIYQHFLRFLELRQFLSGTHMIECFSYPIHMWRGWCARQSHVSLLFLSLDRFFFHLMREPNTGSLRSTF